MTGRVKGVTFDYITGMQSVVLKYSPNAVGQILNMNASIGDASPLVAEVYEYDSATRRLTAINGSPKIEP